MSSHTKVATVLTIDIETVKTCTDAVKRDCRVLLLTDIYHSCGYFRFNLKPDSETPYTLSYLIFAMQ